MPISLLVRRHESDDSFRLLSKHCILVWPLCNVRTSKRGKQQFPYHRSLCRLHRHCSILRTSYCPCSLSLRKNRKSIACQSFHSIRRRMSDNQENDTCSILLIPFNLTTENTLNHNQETHTIGE